MLFKNLIKLLLVNFIFLVNPTLASQLLSHKATYNLNIENIKENSFLEGGQGQTFFEIKEVCNGWNVKEDYVLIYELPNKRTANSISSYTTFENIRGTKHSFELNEKSEFNGENTYQGFAEKINDKILVSIIKQSIKKKSFKEKILFPVEHLRKVIEAAQKGETLFTSKVFFGNEDKNLVKIVSAFISKERKSKFQNIEYLRDKIIWPIKLAFYTTDKKNINPDYEITLELDQLGVVHSYLVNYGDFEVRATLKNFKMIEKKKCK